MEALKVSRNGSRVHEDVVQPRNPLPVDASFISDDVTPLVDNTTAANASCVATLATATTERAYLTKVIIGGLGATGAGSALVTIAGAEGEDIVFPIAIPAGATVALTPTILDFRPPLRGAVGDDITVTVAAAGSGNTRIDATAIGFKDKAPTSTLSS